MNFCKKTEGAISVFLVIILVPCLFITSLFVDVGRVYLSKSMAYSSADLALNTVLTKYDKDLNEWYGLVASCQNMGEFYDVSEEYFMRTISSQNLEEDEIRLMEQVYQNMINQIQGVDIEGVQDLFQTEAVGEVKIEPYENANLTNPVLLKEQVVEFMKYRGPITITSEIISMIMDDDGTINDQFEQLLDSKSDEKIVEAKEVFHESEADFLSKAYKSYSYLYQNYSDDMVQNSDLEEKITQIENVRTTYVALHSKMIHDLYNTENLVMFNRPRVALNAYDSFYNTQNTASYFVLPQEEGETVVYYITATDLAIRKAALEQSIEAFKKSVNNFATQVGTVPYNASTYDVQYWYQTNKIYEGQGYRYDIALKADAMMKNYSYLKSSLTCTADIVDVPSSQLLSECVSALTTVQTLQNQYLADEVSANGDKYLTITLNLERISSDEIWKISPDSEITIDGTKASFNTHLSTSATNLSEIRAFCQNYVDVLDTVIDGNGKDEDEDDCIVSLDRLLTLAQEYEASLDTYKMTTENAQDSSMRDTALEEIAELETEESQNGQKFEKVSAETVTEMKTRLSNIRKQYQDVIDAIDGMTYGGKKLVEITTYSTFKSCASSVVSNDAIGLKKEEINNTTNSTFNSLFVPTSSTKAEIVKLNPTDEFNLFLNLEFDKVNIPQLYRYMFETFGAPDDAKVQEVEDEMDAAEELAESDNCEEVSAKLLNVAAKNVPASVSGRSYAGFSGLVDSIASLSDFIKNFVEFDFDDMRDDLYIVTYILEMFSCATHENEGLYDRYKEKGTSAITELNKSVDVDSAYNDMKKEDEGYWLSTSTVDSYNKSLTNKLINQENNPAYRCEIEYILYGKATNKENIDAAYFDIFAIRTLMNTVSGFVNFWGVRSTTGQVVNTVASTVSAASLGVVPPSAVKLVLILVIIALETCNDMSRLALGFPVELYKIKEENWQYVLSGGDSSAGKISTITSKLKNGLGVKPETTDNGLFYSDYITLFVCIAVSNDTKGPGYLKRMADIMQFNLRKVTGNNKYKLNNSNTHFKLNATLKVNPLLVDISFFDEYNATLKNDDKWLKYNINAIRGY